MPGIQKFSIDANLEDVRKRLFVVKDFRFLFQIYYLVMKSSNSSILIGNVKVLLMNLEIILYLIPNGDEDAL